MHMNATFLSCLLVLQSAIRQNQNSCAEYSIYILCKHIYLVTLSQNNCAVYIVCVYRARSIATYIEVCTMINIFSIIVLMMQRRASYARYGMPQRDWQNGIHLRI